MRADSSWRVVRHPVCTVVFCGVLALLTTASRVTVPAEFPVPVESRYDLNIDSIALGDTLTFVVPQGVMHSGCIVVREGTPVYVRVTRLDKAGFLGKPSLVVLDALWTAGPKGERLFLHGSLTLKGEDLETESIGTTAAFCCLGVFLKGGKQNLAKGIGTVAFTRHQTDIDCETE